MPLCFAVLWAARWIDFIQDYVCTGREASEQLLTVYAQPVAVTASPPPLPPHQLVAVVTAGGKKGKGGGGGGVLVGDAFR